MKSSLTQVSRAYAARAALSCTFRSARLARACAVAALALAPALAVAAEGVVSQLSALKQVVTVDKNGKRSEQFVPITRVVPGDVLQCTVEYANQAGDPAGNVVVTLPIPPEMLLIPNSASTPAAETTYSVDGGQTFSALERLVVVDESGTSRPAAASDVNSVRWQLRRTLAPGQRGKVGYLVTLK